MFEIFINVLQPLKTEVSDNGTVLLCLVIGAIIAKRQKPERDIKRHTPYRSTHALLADHYSLLHICKTLLLWLPFRNIELGDTDTE